MRFCAICVYYGKWPSTMSSWLASCAWNPEIDFLLVSDISTEGLCIPSNVKIFPLSFRQVVTRIADFVCLRYSAASREKIVHALNKPYKLCDYKPLYGTIFAQEVREYDFWGWCDLDLIFGRISKFIPQDALKYVKIFPCGHLSFVVNNEEGNNLYAHTKDFGLRSLKEVAETEKACYYDEFLGVDIVALRKYGERYYNSICFDDLEWGIWKFKLIQEKEKAVISYSFGPAGLYRNECIERAYVHFQKRAMRLVGQTFENGGKIRPNVIVSEGTEYSRMSLFLLFCRFQFSRVLRKLRVEGNKLSRRLVLYESYSS